MSFLNSKPLIHGIESAFTEAGADVEQSHAAVHFDVPSRLLTDLESGQVDLALCPVIDYYRSAVPLEIVPAGGIGCEGPTLTVRLYSTRPIEQIDTVLADTDSHTSIVLLQVLLYRLHGIRPALIDLNAHKLAPDQAGWPEAMLLIGDKVVTDSPPAVRYPHQMDLGKAWHDMTGMPFVFAVWMKRQGEALGSLPAALDRLRQTNASRLDEIVGRYARSLGWPDDLATQYLGHWLRYAIEPRHLRAIEHFAQQADALRLIEKHRPLVVAEDEHAS